MRYKILNYINKHEKCTLTDVAKYCHTSTNSRVFLREIRKLYKEEKLVDCVFHWSMTDCFNKWFITDKGKRIIFRRNKKLKKRKNKTLDK